jgi:hypothetical protein
MCEASERLGVAIARYHGVGGIDWIATPDAVFVRCGQDRRYPRVRLTEARVGDAAAVS